MSAGRGRDSFWVTKTSNRNGGLSRCHGRRAEISQCGNDAGVLQMSRTETEIDSQKRALKEHLFNGVAVKPQVNRS
jgi:hypothetical protein